MGQLNSVEMFRLKMKELGYDEGDYVIESNGGLVDILIERDGYQVLTHRGKPSSIAKFLKGVPEVGTEPEAVFEAPAVVAIQKEEEPMKLTFVKPEDVQKDAQQALNTLKTKKETKMTSNNNSSVTDAQLEAALSRLGGTISRKAAKHTGVAAVLQQAFENQNAVLVRYQNEMGRVREVVIKVGAPVTVYCLIFDGELGKWYRYRTEQVLSATLVPQADDHEAFADMWEGLEGADERDEDWVIAIPVGYYQQKGNFPCWIPADAPVLRRGLWQLARLS